MPIILAGDFNETEMLKHPVHSPAMERLGVKDAAEDNPEPTMRSDNCYGKRWFRHGNEGLDHGVGHFRPLSITRQRHLLAYHGIAMSCESLCQVF